MGQHMDIWGVRRDGSLIPLDVQIESAQTLKLGVARRNRFPFVLCMCVWLPLHWAWGCVWRCSPVLLCSGVAVVPRRALRNSDSAPQCPCLVLCPQLALVPAPQTARRVRLPSCGTSR